MPCEPSLVELKAGVAGEPGLPRFWRCLEELAGDPEFDRRLHQEFSRYAAAWDPSTMERRKFLQLMAASVALATAQGCSSPPLEPIVPYVRPPEGMIPGIPLYFATAMPLPEGGLGLVVTSHTGRPTKVEGNPLHPASLGGTDAQAQASVLTLYDPDRSQTVTHLGEISTWGAAAAALREAVAQSRDGAGIHVLSPPIWSPTLARQRAALLAEYPRLRWHTHAPFGSSAVRRGAEQAFGDAVQPRYRFAEADVVVALDADFLAQGSSAVRDARDFMSRRDLAGERPFNRLYMVESSVSPTGATADHRLPLPPRELQQFVRALAGRLGAGPPAANVRDSATRWVEAVSRDLETHRGRSVILLGDHHPAELHALVHRMNVALGNVGTTLEYLASVAVEDDRPEESLPALIDALQGGRVDLLLLWESNPVYTAPPGLAFPAALAKARQSVHVGLYTDETSEMCHWHIPATHYLESWSDVRAFDGTAAIIQPLIAPLYSGLTIHEVVSALARPTPVASYDLVRETWQAVFEEEFDERWETALREGVIPNSQAPVKRVTLREQAPAAATEGPEIAGAERGVEVLLLPDPSIGDGRFANNAWLQELPKPLTKLTWGNAALLGPETARQLRVNTQDVLRLQFQGETLLAPVLVQPGHPENSLTCHVGYGRLRAGTVGNGLGFNAYRLQARHGGAIVQGVRVTAAGTEFELARTQTHHAIEGRNIVHSAPLDQYQADPQSLWHDHGHHELPTLLPVMPAEGFAWGMAIDLSKCHGCNACVIACQSENNIPVVGQQGVLQGREMHWLRIDHYYSGTPQNPETLQQPMLCQHCEMAPCETVCPVAATTHSNEGLNEMTYNRCIGTRYCSNNCPYKVRRFNFFQYQDQTTPVLKLLRNPEVTVRSRGVMEKCSFCVQRISHARIDAKSEAINSGQPPRIEDGALQTACQQACPSEAIVFGNLNDPGSRVARMKADPRNYGVLAELGTRPRTTYLARLRNLNSELAEPRTDVNSEST